MKSRTQGRILCAAMLLCGLAIVVSSASAQDSTPPPMPERSQGGPQGPGGPGRGMMDPERRSQMLKDRLGLSDAQAAQVKAVFEDERTKSQALMADQTGDRESMRPKMEAIRKDSETRIAAILTPDQKAKWDEMRAQQRGRGPGGPPPGSTPPPQTPPQQ
jgi:protein CpxP